MKREWWWCPVEYFNVSHVTLLVAFYMIRESRADLTTLPEKTNVCILSLCLYEQAKKKR